MEEKSEKPSPAPHCMLPENNNACERMHRARVSGTELKAGCRGCGWDKDEFEARRKLPLVEDADGLQRKHFCRSACKPET